MDNTLLISAAKIALLSVMVLSCGQPGDLYLKDSTRASVLEKSGSNPEEVARIKARAENYDELVALRQLLAEKHRANPTRENYVKLKQVELEIGKIILQRQQESRYGNF